MPKAPRVKQERSAKQKISDLKNITTYERWDDNQNFLKGVTVGFVVGAMFVFIIAWIIFGMFK